MSEKFIKSDITERLNDDAIIEYLNIVLEEDNPRAHPRREFRNR